MPETLTILEKSVSYRSLDGFLLGVTWTVLAVLAVRALWNRQQRILGGLLGVVVVIFALVTIEQAGDLYRDTHPARSIFTFADGQVTIRRSRDEKPESFRPGEVEHMNLAPLLPGRTDQLLLFGDRIYVVDVSATESHRLAETLARVLQLTPAKPSLETWRYTNKAE